MSRIHEALKKAEQERASQHTSDAVPFHRDITIAPPVDGNHDGAVGDILVTTDEAVTPDITSPRDNGYLRFEELVARCARPKWRLDPSANVFFNQSLSPQSAEQFRTLRSRLYQIRSAQTLRTLLITSALPAEGKTFVTTNLAQAFVRQPDHRVLIIDADLRRSRLHLPLGAPSTPGLTEYLRGEADPTAVIQHGQDGNLCLIPGGAEVSNPSELLLNGRLKMLLEYVTPVFDWVVLDSPPCLPVADANVIGSLCDAVLLVVRAASTPSDVAQRACQELQGRNVIGVVLNATEEGAGYTSYYYYQRYGEDGKREE
jgi:protein-tyrosine kinase